MYKNVVTGTAGGTAIITVLQTAGEERRLWNEFGIMLKQKCCGSAPMINCNNIKRLSYQDCSLMSLHIV